MSPLHTRILFLCALTLAVGCDNAPIPTDASSGPDAARDPLDAGPAPFDAGDTDAGDTDAGDADAGDTDAGPPATTCPSATLCGDTEIVVDADWLATHLGEADLQVIDVRGEGDFLASRIDGALRIDGGALRATVGGIAGQVVNMAQAQTVFRAAGLRDDAAIVVYGARTGTGPARLVWTLEYFGHERVALLEGGFATWNNGTRATASGAATPAASTYTITAIDEARRVDADFIVARLDDPTLTLVDARSDGEYAAGRLPGAFSMNWTRNLAGDDLLDDAALRALYATLDPTDTTVTYCQTGSRASVAYVVLRFLGFSDVRLYDGSWAEWGSRSELPREP